MGTTSIPPVAAAEGDDIMLRQRVFDPDFWLSTLAWAVVAWSCVQVALFSFGRDQTIYAQVADTVLNGGMPYRDSWDFKPPGIFIVYTLAHGLFGKAMVAPRLVEAVGMVGMTLAFRRFSFEVTGKRLPGHLGGAVACLVHAQMEFWHTGQPESFGGFLTAIALMLTVRTWVKWRRVAAWLGIGALFGFCFLLKPPLAGAALLSAIYVLRRELEDEKPLWRAAIPTLYMVGGALIPIALTALWFVVRGAWADLHWTLFVFTPGYTAISLGQTSASAGFYQACGDLFYGYSSLIAVGVLAAIAIRPLHSREREALFMVFGMLSIQLAGVVMQAKFFPYHYGASVHLAGLIAGIGFYKLWRRMMVTGLGGVFAFGAFIFLIANMRLPAWDLQYGGRPSFWQRSEQRLSHLFGRSTRVELDASLYWVADYSLGADREAAVEVERLTKPDARIFVWGFEPSIYWMAARAPSTRFIYNVAQRASWGRDFARQMLMDDLAKQPPELIVVQHGDRIPWVTGDRRDSAEAVDTFPALEQLLEASYVEHKTVDRFTIYKRR